MAKQADETILSLKQVNQAAEFEGFLPDDFGIFDIHGVSERMPRLKAQLTPKLKQIGLALADRMPAVLDEPVFAHVAQHLRRSVNAPDETWVAFAHNARAYKPFVHIRSAISGDRIRVVAFVEDYADEKLTFAENLAQNAESLAAWCLHHPTIHAYDMLDAEGEIRKGHTLDADAFRAFSKRLATVKGQHARFGIDFSSTHPVVQNGPELLEAILTAARTLRPIYDCGKPGFDYQYAPEIIEGI